MSTIARAWDAFIQALDEAQQLRAKNADVGRIFDLVRHARELLDIIEQELALESVDLPGDARVGLAQLRQRVQSLEQDVVPARH
jgi:hypothetical protein